MRDAPGARVERSVRAAQRRAEVGDPATQRGSGQIEQLLVEAAEAADPVNQMDLENPMT